MMMVVIIKRMFMETLFILVVMIQKQLALKWDNILWNLFIPCFLTIEYRVVTFPAVIQLPLPCLIQMQIIFFMNYIFSFFYLVMLEVVYTCNPNMKQINLKKKNIFERAHFSYVHTKNTVRKKSYRITVIILTFLLTALT